MGGGGPLAFVVTGGNVNDCTRFTHVMDAICVPRVGPGRPRSRPEPLLGDKGNSPNATRPGLRRHHTPSTTPYRKAPAPTLARRGCARGRPPAFDAQTYK